MSTDVCATVHYIPSFAHYHMHGKRQRQLKLFCPENIFEYVGLDIVGRLPKTKQGHQSAVEMTVRNTILAKAVPSTKSIATKTVCIFVEYWVVNYGIPTMLNTDNGP